MNKYLFIILIGFCFASANAQTFYFKHYQTDNGLSDNALICGIQDTHGFIWVGTKTGLDRFDGVNFKIYRNNPKDSTSLGNNIVLSLFQDKQGSIWVGTFRGIFKYNSQTESFTPLANSPKALITAIGQDKQNNLWFIADNEVLEYNAAINKVIRFPIGNEQCFALCITTDGNIWVSSLSGHIYRYDKTQNNFKTEGRFMPANGANDFAIVKIIALDNTRLLIGTRSQGVRIFNIAEHNFNTVPISYKRDEFLIKDLLYANGELWVATEAGIYIYNWKDSSTVILKKEIFNPYSLSDSFASFLIKDRENTMWVGTSFGGLNAYSEKLSLFKKYYAPDNNQSLSGNVINNIRKDNTGRLWISTADAGINTLNPVTGVFSKVDILNSKGGNILNIPSLLVEGNKLWVGTYEYGLYLTDIRTGKTLSHYGNTNKAGCLGSNFIVCLYKSKANDIYVGTSVGLYHYHPSSGSFTLLCKGYMKCITEDDNGLIWVGTYNDGVYTINTLGKQINNYRTSDSNNNSLSDNGVNAIFQDSDKNMWFATERGLSEADRYCKIFKRYSIDNGLPSETIFSILEDTKKNLWITTKNGLVSLNLRGKKQFEVFTKTDGLVNNEFNYATAFKDDNGIMYLGTCHGMMSFNPLDIKKDTYSPPVYITGLQVNNKLVIINKTGSPLKQSIIVTKQIELKYNESSFSFDFAALSFVAPKKLSYAYQMVGLDEGWTYLESNRRVYFTNLNPGTYKFRVKATNSSGLWNTNSAELVVKIASPWWASNSAYFVYLCLAGLVIYYTIRLYLKRAREKLKHTLEQFENEKEREIYHAKIEFFTHIMHEIRTPLTLIKGPLENVMKSTPESFVTHTDLKMVEKNTNRLLDLANQLLDFRKAGSKDINLNFVKSDISELLTSIYNDFKSLAQNKACDFELELPVEKVFADVDIDAISKILFNLFTNAIKYADRFICFRLIRTNDSFVIESQNDGYLIPVELEEKVFEPFFRLPETQKQQGNGIGLALCRSLAELHNGKLCLNNRNQQLNTFSLTLPLQQDNSFILNLASENPIEVNQHLVTGEKPIILIVDDNIEINEFLMRTLRPNYRVIGVSNGQEALNIVSQRTIQLILSDVMMPVMDGFELCRIIKTDLETSHIPVILLTAKNALQSKIEGLDLGADVYIEKPFSPEHLLVQVNALLKNRETIKTYFANSPLAHIKNITHSKADEVFLEKLNNAILINIAETDLDVNKLADVMNTSKPTLYRKIKAISNLSPNELITLARLKKAAELLASDEYKIYEISNMVGFNSQTYFGHSFYKQFNMTPKEYAQSKRTERGAII